jgi:hypothetical protein
MMILARKACASARITMLEPGMMDASTTSYRRWAQVAFSPNRDTTIGVGIKATAVEEA